MAVLNPSKVPVKMKHIVILLSFIYLKAGVSIHLQVPTNVYAGEATTINCTSSIQNFRYTFTPIMILRTEEGCTKQDNDAYSRPSRIKNYLQKSFTITCKKGNHTIKCLTNSISQTGTIQLQVVDKPPKVINKPRNITTNVGLPVTLTCYVEGDPNHYWVGWMSRNTVIQAGEEHSISTAPNFKSANGSIHHLTIHSVKEAGKYECKVYTITGDVQDQLTQHVNINDHDDGQAESSFWDILRRFFF